MKKLIGLVLLATALGACSTFQTSTEDALSPSALVATQAQRCERDARVAAGPGSPTFPSPGNMPRMDVDTAADVNRAIYWHCASQLPTTK